jgi:hypothetical protein
MKGPVPMTLAGISRWVFELSSVLLATNPGSLSPLNELKVRNPAFGLENSTITS